MNEGRGAPGKAFMRDVSVAVARCRWEVPVNVGRNSDRPDPEPWFSDVPVASCRQGSPKHHLLRCFCHRSKASTNVNQSVIRDFRFNSLNNLFEIDIRLRLEPQACRDTLGVRAQTRIEL